MLLKRTFLFLSLFVQCVILSAQAVHSDSTRVDSPVVKKPVPRSGILPIDDLISNSFITRIGLFTVYQYKDTVYFEIPDSILHRDIEVINRLEKGPGGTGAYAGEELDEKTIQFERHNEDSSIRVRYDMVISTADSNSEIYKAVSNSNLNPVVISFPIRSYGREGKSCLIDVSKWLRDSRSFINSIDPRSPIAQKVNIYAQRDLNVELIHAYPINVELSISKNSDTRPTRDAPNSDPVTLITHCSFVELPQEPMQQRIADERVGYFTDQEWHYGDRQQKVEDRRFILRWRLEPKDEDREKYARGELVEPKKPIIIYIDPATPIQWRPYLIQGINDWQKAFEQAGFKNAIIGKEWPDNDWTMHPDDARYSFINYLPSEIENAYGPQIHDPRSGEIIQTRIGWYHNVMQLLHDWYMVQAGATDPRARHAKFDDDLMGELIRFVASHEVGHTLGLRHNMGASSTVPVDSLRNKHFLQLHGHSPSIMDYARFNYVAQPEDSISEDNLFPKIGEYDRWAIEWGYRLSGSQDPELEKLVDRKMVSDSLARNPRLWFGADNRESGRKDPRCQTEDLGDNAMQASTLGIKNLKRILPNLPEWTKESEGGYEELTEMYRSVKNQYFRYMQHVMMNVGGVYSTPKSQSDSGSVVQPTPMAKQKQALAFFDKELFETPYWILDNNVTSLVSEPKQPDFVEDLQIKALNTLLDIKKIDDVLANQNQFGAKAFPLDEYIGIIHKSIWKELRTASPAMDSYRRNLQKAYIASAQNILLSTDADQTETDAFSLVRADVLQLQKEITLALPKVKDKLSRYHLEDMLVRIKKTLEANPVIQ